MSEINAGICIGGPVSGHGYACRGPWLHVAVAPPMNMWRDPSINDDEFPQPEVVTYRHLHNEHGDWWVVA